MINLVRFSGPEKLGLFGHFFLGEPLRQQNPGRGSADRTESRTNRGIGLRARKNPHGTSGAGPKLAPQRTSAFILPSCLGFSLVLPHKLLKLLKITGLIVGDTHRAGNAGPSHFSGDELPEPASELCPPPRIGQITLHLEDGLP